MGLEDRDYLREEAIRYGGGGGGFGAPRPKGGPMRVVTKLVIVCSVLFLIDAFTKRITAPDPDDPAKVRVVSNQLFDWMALKSNEVFSSEIASRPWNIYQIFSYGFAHSSMSAGGLFHILFNMIVLWQLGRVVEDKLGGAEFLSFYLTSIVFAGVVFGIVHLGRPAAVVGASGAVTAVLILFALYFPYQPLHLYGIIQIKGWQLGVFCVGINFLFALVGSGDRVAYEAHLGGAAFAGLYFYFGWRFERILPAKWFSKRSPNLRVRRPDDEPEFYTAYDRFDDQDSQEEEVDPQLEKDAEMADQILEKLHREGEKSLSRKERKFLERYSKKVRSRRP